MGRRLTMNLGPQIFTWEKKKKKERKKSPSVNGISKYLLLQFLARGPRGLSGGRRNRQIKVKDKLLSAPFPSPKTLSRRAED